jgi:hypothetical protein
MIRRTFVLPGRGTGGERRGGEGEGRGGEWVILLLYSCIQRTSRRSIYDIKMFKRLKNFEDNRGNVAAVRYEKFS